MGRAAGAIVVFGLGFALFAAYVPAWGREVIAVGADGFSGALVCPDSNSLQIAFQQRGPRPGFDPLSLPVQCTLIQPGTLMTHDGEDPRGFPIVAATVTGGRTLRGVTAANMIEGFARTRPAAVAQKPKSPQPALPPTGGARPTSEVALKGFATAHISNYGVPSAAPDQQVISKQSATAGSSFPEEQDKSVHDNSLVKRVCTSAGMKPNSKECIQALANYAIGTMCKNKGINPDPYSQECQRYARDAADWLKRAAQCPPGSKEDECPGPSPQADGAKFRLRASSNRDACC